MKKKNFVISTLPDNIYHFKIVIYSLVIIVNSFGVFIGTTQGRTSRSRAIISQGIRPCDEKLWESKACPAMDCTDFVWVASPWIASRREISCQTTGGVQVNQGKEKCEEASPDMWLYYTYFILR